MNEPPTIDKLQLEPSPIRIGDIRLELLTVENITPFLSELEDKGDEALQSFPYWIKIWESAIILAAHLAEQNLDKTQTVLELGAGMGVVGMFLAASGHPVTLTDYNDDALALMKQNVDRNNLSSARIQKLDWNDPPRSMDKYDIVCGAELVYRQTDAEPVLQTIRQCLKPDGAAFLAHNIRQLSMVEFLAQAGEIFDIEHTGKSITMDGKKKQVVIHTMRGL